MEKWKKIIGYEDLYEVSNLGRVRSFHKKHLGRDVFLTAVKNGKGYLRFTLNKNGRGRGFYVHSLVLSVFSHKRPSGLVCRHLNGDPLDNRLENLKWGTVKQNSEDMIRHGRSPIGERKCNAKLNDQKVKLIKILYFHFNWRMVDIFNFFKSWNITKPTMVAALEGKSWKHITSPPKKPQKKN